MLTGKSLFLFSGDNAVREFLHTVVKSWIFEGVIILFIIASSVILAFEHPLEDPNSEKI